MEKKKKKRIQLNDDLSLLSLSLSLCLSLSYTNLFQIGSNHMYCPRIRMWSHQREGGGGENPNSIFVGKYLIIPSVNSTNQPWIFKINV